MHNTISLFENKRSVCLFVVSLNKCLAELWFYIVVFVKQYRVPTRSGKQGKKLCSRESRGILFSSESLGKFGKLLSK
jgi:hypothetical protein